MSIKDLGFASYDDMASKFGDPTPLYSTEWEIWYNDCIQLTERYHDSIAKALSAHFSDGGSGGDTLKIVDEIIAAAVEATNTFSTIRQGTATNTLTKIRAQIGKNTQVDDLTGEATIKQGDIISFNKNNKQESFLQMFIIRKCCYWKISKKHALQYQWRRPF
mgnify:CR=1 FL=1